MEDTFLTIASPSEGIYREKGSKFLAFACPVSDEQQIREKTDALHKKYFDARHHCYAWRLGADGTHYRANDDGEPSGSAGKPILGQIVSAGLTNTLVVVVRYFGGILLGTGGLAQAYKRAAADALAHATVISGMLMETCHFSFDYADMNQILRIVKDMALECSEQEFHLRCSMKVRVRKSLADAMKQRLEALNIIMN